MSSVCGVYLLLKQHQTMRTRGHNDALAEVDDGRRRRREEIRSEREKEREREKCESSVSPSTVANRSAVNQQRCEATAVSTAGLY